MIPHRQEAMSSGTHASARTSARAGRAFPITEPLRPPVAAANPRAAAEAEPAGRPSDGSADLRLMAISSQDGRPVAVIGGRLVHEDDRFEGVHVVRIGESEVEVEVRGHRRVLRF